MKMSGGIWQGCSCILLGKEGEAMPVGKIMDTLAVMYVNKRGGKEVSDSIWMDYGYEYIEFVNARSACCIQKSLCAAGKRFLK